MKTSIMAYRIIIIIIIIIIIVIFIIIWNIWEEQQDTFGQITKQIHKLQRN